MGKGTKEGIKGLLALLESPGARGARVALPGPQLADEAWRGPLLPAGHTSHSPNQEAGSATWGSNLSTGWERGPMKE